MRGPRSRMRNRAAPPAWRLAFSRRFPTARALILELFLEPLRHLVHRVREDGHLAELHASIAHVDARVHVARADLAGDALELRPRRRDATRHEARERPKNRERDEDAEPNV